MNSIFNQIEESIIIMFLGMACVFIFLLLMIFFINLTHIFIDKYVLKKKDENKNKNPNIPEKTINIAQSDDIINKSKHIDNQNKDVDNLNMTEDIVSAIFSAIKQYEVQKNKSFIRK